MSLFDAIRDGCRAVAEQASHVRIDHKRLADYAGTLNLAESRAPTLDPAYHLLGRGEDTVAFIVTLDAINFGSGWFPHLRKRPGLSGYFTVAAALTDHCRRHGVPDAAALAALTAADCTRLFGQDPENPPVDELMGLFAQALNDLGRYLLAGFDGRFAHLVDAAQGSAERLVALLARMTFFADVETWRGASVPFYKRAQLTAADLALAFDGRGWGRFSDLHRLTIFADNLVPHVLRLDGVLLYDPELVRRIDAEELIAAGSAEEIEIRAGALHAVELLVAELNRRGEDVTAMGLDYLLWNRGQRPDYKRAKPRHRTRTVYY
jgi:hypothetical protein